MRPWVSVGWAGHYRFPALVDTGAYTTILEKDAVAQFAEWGGLPRDNVEDLGTSVEGFGYFGSEGIVPEVVLHNVSVGSVRFQAVPAQVRDNISLVGMNVLLRYPEVCISWAMERIFLGELGPCARGLSPYAERLSGFTPIVEFETAYSPRTRVLIDTGSDRTACSAAMVRGAGRHFRFGEHKDMWLSCEHDDGYFTPGLPWYDALTGMDTLSRFDAFGWRLHPFTMYFVPKADH